MTSHNLATDELLALLRDSSLRPESIVEEMDCAGCTKPLPAEVSAAREAIVSLDPKSIAALPELLALAAVHAASQAGRAEVLSELAADAPKAVAKEAKRELQKLKQRGVQVPELKQRGEAVLKPLPEAEAPACYASSVDAYGERAVWWARAARGGGGGVEVVQAVISDVKGILAVDALSLSRRSFREFTKRLPRQGVVTTAEVSRDHARWLIAHAESEGARNGFTPAQGYAEALRLLGSAPAEKPALPALDFGADGELPHAMAGAALFSDPLFLSWIPEEDALRSFGLRVDEIATSQLFIDQAQRKEALARASEEAAEAYFTPQRRARYAHRLAEMAHVLESEKRHDAARTAAAVSRALAADGPQPELTAAARAPFCRALFSHAMEGRIEQQPGQEPPRGPLVVP
jgi:hypothetical protein